MDEDRERVCNEISSSPFTECRSMEQRRPAVQHGAGAGTGGGGAGPSVVCVCVCVCVRVCVFILVTDRLDIRLKIHNWVCLCAQQKKRYMMKNKVFLKKRGIFLHSFLRETRAHKLYS